MTTIELEWPMGQILTSNQRLHWAQRSTRTKALRLYAERMAKDLPAMERAHLLVEIGWPDNRRRDAHNLVPTIKACIDGMVDAGILRDDNDTHLVGPDLRTYIARDPGLVHLTFNLTELPIGEAA